MISLIPIEVIINPQSRDQHPIAFLFGDSEITIVDIVDKWYQGESNPEFPESVYYKINGINGAEYLLKHELEHDKWFLCKPDNWDYS